MFQELLLKRMQSLRTRNAFYRGDFRAGGLHAQHEAGIDQAAVQDDAARAAVAVAATLLASGQPEIVSEDLEKRLPRLAEELDVLTVDLRFYVYFARHRFTTPLLFEWHRSTLVWSRRPQGDVAGPPSPAYR